MSQTYRVREFAERAGVTVRALHHYDRVGLLEPRRTPAGYRVYVDSTNRFRPLYFVARGAAASADGRTPRHVAALFTARDDGLLRRFAPHAAFSVLIA